MFHVKHKYFKLKLTQKTVLKTKDFLVSGEEFSLIESEKKDLLKTTPVPKYVEKYYQSEEYISHTDSKYTIFEKAYQLVKKIALHKKVRLINKLNKGSGKLLDVGSGTGDFLAVAKKNNWNVFGVEPNSNARALSHNKGITVFENLNEIHETNFDVITLWHVLEHVQDIDSYIFEISKKLKTNGVLIIAVPNYKSKDAQFYKEYWAAFDVPRHLWHFSKEGIKRILKKHEFLLLKIKPMWFDSFYVSMLSEKYKSGRINWIRAILIGTISNLSGILSKEYSSHIYIFKKP